VNQYRDLNKSFCFIPRQYAYLVAHTGQREHINIGLRQLIGKIFRISAVMCDSDDDQEGRASEATAPNERGQRDKKGQGAAYLTIIHEKNSTAQAHLGFSNQIPKSMSIDFTLTPLSQALVHISVLSVSEL
jgi:hypothetical protein